MIMEIIVGIIGITFAILATFCVINLQRLGKVLKKTDCLINEVHLTLRSLSGPSVMLIDNTNELISDVKKKSEALDLLFHPLYGIKKELSSKRHKGLEKVCDLLEYVTQGIQLFSKIKDEIKK